MVPLPSTPRRPASARSRTRPNHHKANADSNTGKPSSLTSEPPPKKRRYIPGGPGGGGRYVDEDGTEVPVGGTGPGGYHYVGPRGRVGAMNLANGVQPPPVATPKSRRAAAPKSSRPARPQIPTMRFPSAAHAAAAAQGDGYKPREERAWEEFHPDLDINSPFMAFSANEVDGVAIQPATPVLTSQPVNGLARPQTPNGDESTPRSEGFPTPTTSLNGDPLLTIPGTPGSDKRRPGRPPKDPIAFFAARTANMGSDVVLGPPNTSKPTLAINNINAKEKLTLPQPSFRLSNTLARFEDKALGLVRYVDKSMANVGYQESDIFIRPEGRLIKASDAYLDDDLDAGPAHKSDGEAILAASSGGVGRVEYDMDDQDDMWLKEYNIGRSKQDKPFPPITREILEITITKIEKEWHALEKRIPKPNPKPPQTQRPRSSSAAAVNGEPQAGEEQDSKCAICDDGDCENTNAIVFCDGCDLAVHQECYGVPFIPEGQWLCRKCQLIGRGIPTCIFCPNTDGAFKQTTASKWAHLLCAMWIPEVSLGNHTFMEPVMDVEKVPKSRWKLNCYICDQRMGACIQCGNKSCYLAFHVTCARRSRLFLKMKNSHGTLAVIDGTTVLKAFCDRHCPADYSKENDVRGATRRAKKFYRRTMRGRLWADSQASAAAMAATHRHAVTEHQPDESQLTGEKVALVVSEAQKKGNQPPKPVWKLPSGAPVIPQVVFTAVESSLQRFSIGERRKFVQDACRYWTLKREARRGAALVRRFQLQSEAFSSMEMTRRNFPSMGAVGKQRLARRIEFAKTLVEDLEKLRTLAEGVRNRELAKLEAALLEVDIMDSAYFPVSKLLPPVVDKALTLDIRLVFTEGLFGLKEKVTNRFYVCVLPFAEDFSAIFSRGIGAFPAEADSANDFSGLPSKKAVVDLKERKRLAKRIIKAVQPQLEAALQIDSEANHKPIAEQQKELERILDAGLQPLPESVSVSLEHSLLADEEEAAHHHDAEGNIVSEVKENTAEHGTAAGRTRRRQPLIEALEAQDVEMQDVDAPAEDDADISGQPEASRVEKVVSHNSVEVIQKSSFNGPGAHSTNTPPDTHGYVSAPETQEPSVPTPPISVGENNAIQAQTLEQGGVPWYLKEFQFEGTKPQADIDAFNFTTLQVAETGEMEEADGKAAPNDAVEGQGEDVGRVVGSPTTVKKAKAKKKWRGYRYGRLYSEDVLGRYCIQYASWSYGWSLGGWSIFTGVVRC